MRIRERAVVVFLVVALSLRATTARADESRDAEALIRTGVQLRMQGKDERALPFFEKAYQTFRTPRTAGQLGLAALAVGYFVDAERYLGEALASPDHPWVSKNLKMLGEQLAIAKGKIGELEVTGSPAGAEVWINGKRVGQLPLAAPLRLDKGRVGVELRAPGYVATSDSLVIVGGKREARSYTLAREPAPPAPLAAPAPPAPAPVSHAPDPDSLAPPLMDATVNGGAAPPQSVVAVAPAPPSAGSVTRTLAWVAAGGALAGVAVGTAEALVASSKRDAFNSHTGNVNGTVTMDCATAALTTPCRALKDERDRALTLSIVGFAVAGALAVAAVTLFALSTPDRASAGPHAVGAAYACMPDPAQRGLTCALRF